MSQSQWGPENPHPLSRMKTELVWEGKYDEYGNRRAVKLPTSPLPLQRIETIDAPCDAARAIAARQGDLFDQDAFTKSSHRDDFRNMLIWGDNKLALAALLEQFRGKVDLIYIDPPFDVGTDFSVDVPFGEFQDLVRKEQSAIEFVAYTDMWGKGTDSYLNMVYERLSLARELLSPTASLYVHCDWRMTALLRQILAEVLGAENFQREIIWAFDTKSGYKTQAENWVRSHETILFASVSNTKVFAKERIDYSPEYLKRFKKVDEDGRRYRDDRTSGVRQYLDELKGVPVADVWNDVKSFQQDATSDEYLKYETQKPESLLRRIISASSNEGDLVLDFFCGSGTTCAVAEQTGRRWIGVDIGRFAVHTSRKRLIGVQRELHAKNEPYRSFDVYNLGRYERQWWQQERLRGADIEHRRAVLKFFRAQPLENTTSPLLHGTRAGAYVHVDSIDSILTSTELRDVAAATKAAGGRSIICLAWEFESELKKRAQAFEAEYGIEISLKYIPREIMEPNRTEIQFFDVAGLDVEVVLEDGKVDVKLTGFYPSLSEVPEKELEALKERALKSPFDFIDFWAVDFEHADDKPFEHHWQDFRTRKDRSLKTASDAKWQYNSKGKKRICVKVIDVFGIDTTKVLEVEV
ncbi:MAG: site-specific DNA-methyltransferase [Fimbriimonadales bacterium]